MAQKHQSPTFRKNVHFKENEKKKKKKAKMKNDQKTGFWDFLRKSSH